MCQSLFVPKIINICGKKLFSFIAAACSKEPGQTHTQGWPGNKKLSISLATNSLLANLNMLEANCDHPSLIALTITSHMALFAEFPSFPLLSSRKLVHVQDSSGKAETLLGWDPGQGLWGIGSCRSLDSQGSTLPFLGPRGARKNFNHCWLYGYMLTVSLKHKIYQK